MLHIKSMEPSMSAGATENSMFEILRLIFSINYFPQGMLLITFLTYVTYRYLYVTISTCIVLITYDISPGNVT